MTYRVLISDPISQPALDFLKEAGIEVDYRPKITPADLVNFIPNYEGLIVRSRTKVTSDVIKAGAKLKVIARAGVGLDNIDQKAASEQNITVLNAYEAAMHSVAELTLCLILNLARKICIGNSSLKNGKWLKNEMMGNEIRGKTLGIVGVGRIGSAVGRLAKAFGMKIMGYDIIPVRAEIIKELDLEQVDLDTLLRRSDFVTLHVSITEESYHLINESKLRLMKPTAGIINISRGSVIDQKALHEALKSGVIGGAALDVFEVEPPNDPDFLSLPNLVCTPHIGAQTFEAQEQAGIHVAKGVAKVLKG